MSQFQTYLYYICKVEEQIEQTSKPKKMESEQTDSNEKSTFGRSIRKTPKLAGVLCLIPIDK